MFRYLVVMLIPCILIVLIYFSTLKGIENYTIDFNYNMLEKSKDMLETRISELDNIVEQISRIPKVICYNYFTQPFEGPNTYKTLETREHLYDYTLTNNLVFDYYLVFLNSNIIMGVEQTYRMEQFYDYFFMYEGMKYEQWYEEISRNFDKGSYLPERKVIFKDKEYNFITYVVT